MNKFWIAHIATYPPRECGIATFTKDLTSALDHKFSPSLQAKIISINKGDCNYSYSNNVISNIIEEDVSTYEKVAKKVNAIDKIRLVNIQHEFGIYGGKNGDYLLSLLENFEKPIVTTLHTILPNPDNHIKRIMKKIAHYSSKIVIMNRLGLNILKDNYDIKKNIEIIPHGTPNIPFKEKFKMKKELGFESKTILMSFGMINPNKGFEYTIDALPEVVKKFPTLLYLIIGETHPEIKKKIGENYRNFLENKVKSLKLTKHVRFINKYITLNEITRYLQASDIFISTNQDYRQIVSGTLAYGASCGLPIISTPYLHAKDLLSPNRGILVKFKDSDSIKQALLKLLTDPELRKYLRYNIYQYTRNAIWPNVAISYFTLYKELVPELKKCRYSVPKIDFKHVNKLTDDFGMIQFSKFNIPDIKSGYTLDDNARALIACVQYYDLFKEETMIESINTYLNFILHVFHESKFYNFVDYNKKINFDRWSEDAHGRALWALGALLSSKNLPNVISSKAYTLFNKGIEIIEEFRSPRSIAFSIIGLYYCFKSTGKKLEKITKLANLLVSYYNRCSKNNWEWFEKSLTYSNSKLSEALFSYYDLTKNENYLEIAEKSLEFLMKHTFIDNIYVPIGENGWFHQNSKRALYDQQPVNTASIVQTLVLAYKLTKKELYLKNAIKAFEWFLGRNTLKQIVYDNTSGGCYDGISKEGINLNQGAESIVTYLLARMELENIKSFISLNDMEVTKRVQRFLLCK